MILIKMKKTPIVTVILILIITSFFLYKHFSEESSKTVFINGKKVTATKEDFSDDLKDDFAEYSEAAKKRKPLNLLDKTCWSVDLKETKKVVFFSTIMGTKKTTITFYEYSNNKLNCLEKYIYRLKNNDLYLYNINTNNFEKKKKYALSDKIFVIDNTRYHSDTFSNYESGE